MPVEQTRERPRQVDQDPRSKTAYLVIAGGLGAKNGMVGIENAFRDVTKSPHINVFNSEMSMDPVNRDRYKQQSEFITSHIQAGRNVEVITHSIGGVEASRDIALILEQDPEFFDNPDNAQKLTVTFTAPGGLEQKRWDKIKFAINYFRLGGPLNRAINAGVAFPPQNMTASEVADGMRVVFRRKKPTDAPLISFHPQDDYYSRVDAEKQADVAQVDTQLKNNLGKKRRWRARRNFKRHGKLFKQEMQDIFDGKHIEGNPHPVDVVSFPHLIRRPEVRSIIREMHTDVLYRTTRFLLEKGVNVKVMGYEQDMSVTRKSINRFVTQTATGDKRAEAAYVEGLGHSGLVLQPHYWVDAVTRHNVADLARMRHEMMKRDAA